MRKYWQYIRRHESKLLGLISTAVVLVFIHSLWVVPLTTEMITIRNQILKEKELIERYRKKLTSAKDLYNQLKEEEDKIGKIQKKVLRTKDPYQLAAEIGELVTSKGRDPGLVIKSYQVLDSEVLGNYQEVRLRFSLLATISGFYRFLERLRCSKEAISFQRLTIQKRMFGKGPDLMITVVIAALMEKTS